MTLELLSYVLLGLNAVIHIVDVITTNGALSNGGYEANPIVAKMMDVCGKLWWAPKLAVAYGALGFAYLEFPEAGETLQLVLVAGLAVLAFIYAKILLKNYRIWKA